MVESKRHFSTDRDEKGFCKEPNDHSNFFQDHLIRVIDSITKFFHQLCPAVRDEFGLFF